jgi:plastocyanin
MSTASTYQRFLPATLLCTLLLAACDTPTPPPQPVATEITIIDGDSLWALAGSTLSRPLAVRVADSTGRPVPGVTIGWAVEEGGGSVSGSTTPSVTNAFGTAMATLTLGREEGAHTVTATAAGIPGAPRVTFTARAVTALVFVAESQDDLYACFYYGLNCSASFSPSEVTVPAGKTVAWLWDGSRRCDVVFEDDPTEPTSSPRQEWGRHFRTFTTPGTFRYRCTLHSTSFTEGMVGTVTVR